MVRIGDWKKKLNVVDWNYVVQNRRILIDHSGNYTLT